MGKVPHGGWSDICEPTGQVIAADPIVFPGQYPTPHQHETFGQQITPDTTPADLRANQAAGVANTCSGVPGQGQPSPTAYWAPALCSDATCAHLLHAAKLTAYFRTELADPASVVDLDENLAMVAGNARATALGDNPHATWVCQAGDKPIGTPGPQIPDSCPVTDDQGNPVKLKLDVTFPRCWDGQGGPPNWNATTGSGRQHFVYSTKDLTRRPWPTTCPADHPIVIPQIIVDIRYRLDFQTCGGPCFPVADGSYDLSRAAITSDHMDMGGVFTLDHGGTAHVDLMLGLTSDALDELGTNCTRAAVICGPVLPPGER